MLAVAAATASWRDISQARSHVAVAGATLQQVAADSGSLQTPEGRAGSLHALDGALASVRGANRQLRRSAALAVVGALPGLRPQRAGLIRLVDDAETAVSASRALLVRLDELAPTARIRDGVVPLPELRGLEEAAESAAGKLSRLVDHGGALWGDLGRSRRRFDQIIGVAADRLASGADAIRAARGFLGEGGDRRYLVAVQNNAEMRDQGMVLSYVAVSFSGGRLGFGADGSVDALALATAVPTPLPPGTSEVFGPLEPTRLWQSVNATADFALSGRVMADMFRQATGTPIDGVIAIDLPGLAALLAVVGSVEIPQIPEPIASDNAARILLNDLYQGLPPLVDDPERAGALSQVSRAVFERLTTGDRDAVALGRELGRVSEGGHLRLWSAEEDEEAVFERVGLGGGPGLIDADRTFHLAVQNRTATKLDYYLKPTVRQDIELDPAGSATVHTTVVLDNQAPVDGAPSFQLGPDQFMSRPGEYLGWVLLWAPIGSTQPGPGVEESGLVLAQHSLLVEPGGSRQLTFETVIPNAVRDGRFELRLVPQPRLYPVPLEVTVSGPGWRFEDKPSWSGHWDRVLNLSWSVDR